MAAASVFYLYGANKGDLRLNDLTNSNIRFALVTSTYSPIVTAVGDSLWATVSGNEIASASNGYTAGGAVLTGAVAATSGNNGFKFSTGNATWTAAGSGIPAWRYAVMYYLGTVWGKTNPLIGYFIGDGTPADTPLTTLNNPLTLTCPSTGWFDET